jgi:hypothetical protein
LVVPPEDIAGVHGHEQFAAGEPAQQRPAAHLLADGGGLLWRQRRGVEEPAPPLVQGLEQAVKNAAVVMDYGG